MRVLAYALTLGADQSLGLLDVSGSECSPAVCHT
jgi:hypothetical protein